MWLQWHSLFLSAPSHGRTHWRSGRDWSRTTPERTAGDIVGSWLACGNLVVQGARRVWPTWIELLCTYATYTGWWQQYHKHSCNLEQIVQEAQKMPVIHLCVGTKLQKKAYSVWIYSYIVCILRFFEERLHFIIEDTQWPLYTTSFFIYLYTLW